MSNVTQKLGQISKIRPDQIQILCPSLRICGQLPAPIVNGRGDENGRISNSEGIIKLKVHLASTGVGILAYHHKNTKKILISMRIHTTYGKLVVREWHTVTVAWFHVSKFAIGIPTILLRPNTTARFPTTDTPSNHKTVILKHLTTVMQKSIMKDFVQSMKLTNTQQWVVCDICIRISMNNTLLLLYNIFLPYPYWQV